MTTERILSEQAGDLSAQEPSRPLTPEEQLKHQQVRRGQTARQVLLKTKSSPGWALMSPRNQALIDEILDSSQTLYEDAEKDTQLPTLRVTEAIFQIKLGLSAQGIEFEDQPHQEPKIIEVQLPSPEPIPEQIKEIPTIDAEQLPVPLTTGRRRTPKKTAYKSSDLSQSTNEDLYRLIQQGLAARTILHAQIKTAQWRKLSPEEKTLALEAIARSQNLRGFTTLPENTKKAPIRPAAKALRQALDAKDELTGRLKEEALSALPPDLEEFGDRLIPVVEDAFNLALISFNPKNGSTFEENYRDRFQELSKSRLDAIVADRQRPKSLMQFLQDLDIDYFFYRKHNLADGLNLKKIGRTIIFSPEDQAAVRSNLKKVRTAISAKQQAENSTREEIRLARQKAREPSLSRSRAQGKETTQPEGHIRLSVFLKNHNISAQQYHKHNIGEGIVQNRRGVSPLLSPNQQELLKASIEKYQKQKQGKKPKPAHQNTKIPEGTIKLSEFLKSKSISSYVFYNHNMGDEVVETGKGLRPLVDIEQQKLLEERITNYEQEKTRRRTKTKPEKPKPPEGSISLTDLVADLKISKGSYHARKLGEGLDLVKVGNSIYFTQEQKEQVGQKLESQQALPRRTSASKIREGYVRVNDFLKTIGISYYMFNHHNLNEGLAKKRGQKRLHTLSPEDQETIRTRWQEINQKQEKAKTKRERENRMKQLPLIREITKLIPSVANIDPVTFRDLYMAKDKRLMNRIAEPLSRLTPTELGVISGIFEGLNSPEVGRKTKRTQKEVKLIKQIAQERLLMTRTTFALTDYQDTVGEASSGKIVEELENITFQDIDSMILQASTKLAGTPDISWQKASEVFGISAEVVRIIVYLGSNHSGRISLGEFIEKSSYESLPVWHVGPTLANVRQILLKTNSLHHAFIKAHPRNDNWLASLDHAAPITGQRRRQPSHGKLRL